MKWSNRKRWNLMLSGTMLSLGLVQWGCSTLAPTQPPNPQTPQNPQPYTSPAPDQFSNRQNPTPLTSPAQPSVTPIIASNRTIMGQIFVDRNSDARLESNEAPIANWPIYLYAYQPGQKVDWNTPLATVAADKNGGFEFKGLSSTSYLVAAAASSNGQTYQLNCLDANNAQRVLIKDINGPTDTTQGSSRCAPIGSLVDLQEQPSCNIIFTSPSPSFNSPGFGGPDFGGPGFGGGGFGGPGFGGLDLGGGGFGIPYPYPYPYPYPNPTPRPTPRPTPSPTPSPTPTPGNCGLPVNLASASNFVILAGSAVTNTGPSIVTGDLGLSPGTATAITGFPPGILIGFQHAADAIASQAKTALAGAYTDAAGRTGALVVPNGQLGGLTLYPGVYTTPNSSTGFDIANYQTLTLDAGACGANAVWIFQSPSTVVANTYSKVLLLNGARASNVYWAVYSSATIGVNSTFKGTVMAQASITLNTGANLVGRALAGSGAVTLEANIVTLP